MEKSLIKRIQSGDKEAFHTLYDLYSDYSLRVAFAVVKNNTDAADVVQETFMKIYSNIFSFDASKPFKPWFYKILINECCNVLRKRNKTISITNYLENSTEPSTNDVYDFVEYESLYKAIENLSDLHRIPIVLKYLNGFSEKEISDILDIKVNTVKSRLFHGREKLKCFFEKMKERGLKHGS